MREPRILLIYPPNQLMPIETPRPDGSLGPLYLAGEMRKMGIEVDLVDASVGTEADDLADTFYRSVPQANGLIRIGMSWERIEAVIAAGRYDIVGINSNFTPQTKMALAVAQIAKRLNPETVVVAGGVNARSLPDRFLTRGAVDLICVTEGEKVFREIVTRWMRNDSLDGIPGTMIGREETIVRFPVADGMIATNLDDLPLPAWDKLPFTKYEAIAAPHGVNLANDRLRYAPIMTSRGCPFWCKYCHVSEEKEEPGLLAAGDIGSLRVKSVGRVLEEIEILLSLGVRKVFIEDDSLLAKKRRVKQIFSLLLGKGLKVANVNGVNLVHFFQRTAMGGYEPDGEYLELLKEAGFDQIVFPVESGSQRILNAYAAEKLKLDRHDVVALTRLAAKTGILCPVNMMIGFPDETEKEMMMSVELAKRLSDAGAPYVTFFIPIPFPGSVLYRIAIERGHLSSDFDPDIMNWGNGVMMKTVVPRERIIEIRDWAWRTVNPPKYVETRLKQSIGSRWSGQT